jgi:prevent-host-death family protein
MRIISFTKFRNNASIFLSAAEKEEIVIVMRHGKPIAKIVSTDINEKTEKPLKKSALRLVIKGKNLSSAILEEREK